MGHYMTLTLLLLSGISCICCQSSSRRFYYIDTLKNWTEAQIYCRQRYTDLATLTSMEEVDSLKRPSGMYGFAWIGLKDHLDSWKGTTDNASNSWRWSTPTETLAASGYQNWKSGQPDFTDAVETCVLMGGDGLWSDENCNLMHTFVCYTDVAPNVRSYDFISTTMTWKDAQTHCRTQHTDLPLIASAADNAQVLATMPPSSQSWLALFRVPFVWSDGSTSSFRHWNTNEPNNKNKKQPCVSENNSHTWADFYCSSEFVVLCYADPIRQSSVKMVVRTRADPRLPAIGDQIQQQLKSILEFHLVNELTLRWKILTAEPPEEHPLLPCLINL